MTDDCKSNSENEKTITVFMPSSSGDASDQSGRAASLCDGQIVEERYRVLNLVGRGGMGSVYKVEEILSKRILALKTLHPESLSETTWRRFQKEVQASQRLDHPTLIRIYHLGLIAGSQPYFVMEFFEGKTLAEQIKTTGCLELETALLIFIQTCFALGYAHKMGVIHRDLKPSNIMISGINQGANVDVRIVDFGIAKVIDAEETKSMTLTKTGEIFGTPYYMSPEQCLGVAIDHRSDIYSLGCVLYEALAGTPPFLGESALPTMMKHQSERPQSLKEASFGKEFPETIENLVMKLLEKRPDDRYQNLYDAAHDMNEVMISLRSGSSPEITKARSERLPAAKASPLRTTRNTSDISGIALYAVVLAACSIGAFILGRQAPRELWPLSKPTATSVSLITQPDHFDNRYSRPPLDVNYIKSEYYSSWSPSDPATRLFHFPPGPENSLGMIVDVPPGVKFLTIKDGALVEATRHAHGDVIVKNFQPFGLAVSDLSQEEPDLMRKFRPDELKTIEQINSYYPDQSLAYLSSLPSVESLNIRDSKNLTDNCFTYINELPNLKKLSVGQEINSAGILRLKRLRNLNTFRCKSMDDSTRVLSALAGSTAIEELGFRHGLLKDSDCRLIATMPNLKRLDISMNGLLSEKALEYLRTLSKLEFLYIQGSNLHSSCIPTLQKFPKLRSLTIGTTRWSAEERWQLGRALPRCRLYIDYDTPMQ